MDQTMLLAAPTDHEGLLLLQRLEAAMTELGSGVDELEVDLLQGTALRLHQQGLEDDSVRVNRGAIVTLQHTCRSSALCQPCGGSAPSSWFRPHSPSP